MKRRNFIKTTTLATIPFALSGIPVMASSNLESSNLELMATAAANCGKILVIIQMNGGNDGLNTVFPLDQWNKLSNARANILMPQSSVLPLNGNLTTGLHPAMPELKSLHDSGKLMIVQGVSYPNPSYSHFRATDIWFTGSNSNEDLDDGWLGRALNIKFPNFPEGNGISYPNNNMPDPLAIQIGSTLPFSLQGPNINMGYSVQNPATLINIINATTDPIPNSDYGSELRFLRLMKDQSNVYRSAIQSAYYVAQPQSATYPTSNSLGDQLKIVAKLINGGLKTPIYIVNHPKSSDLHDNQVLVTDKTQGAHTTNLSILSKAIGAFQKDLELMGKQNLVTGMTFSEFGRRIKSNASLGTDHGTAAPVLVFGAALNTSPTTVAGTAYPVAGMIGTSPVLPTTSTTYNDVPMQFDYRQIYSTIMQDWLCMTSAESNQVLNGTFAKLPIFNQTLLSSTDFDAADNQFVSIYPNPVTNQTLNFEFKDIISTPINIQIYNVQGTLVFKNNYNVNSNQLTIQANNLTSSGLYIVELNYNDNKFFKKIIVP